MFRILALSGGGARGVFQAQFLARLEDELGAPIRERFDLIAATSTGALVGLALASGVPAKDLAGFYLDHAEEVFKPSGFLTKARSMTQKGPRYDVRVLKRLLNRLLADPDTGRIPTLGELPGQVAICACVLNTLRGHVFTPESDPSWSVVDVALASAAAPTYFAPVRGRSGHQGYVDGGLWANDPTWAAIDHAIHGLGKTRPSLRVLTVGTGSVPYGFVPEDVSRLRPLSAGTVRYMIDATASLQEWLTERLCERLVTRAQLLRIDPPLREWIPLDDAERANRELPGRADDAFATGKDDVMRWLREPRLAWSAGPTAMDALETYKEALRDLSERGGVPHTEERVAVYYIGDDRYGDRRSMQVTTRVEEGALMLWRRDRFGVTTGSPGPLTLEDVGLSYSTDDGCRLSVLPIEEDGRTVRVMSILTPPLQGPGSRTATYWTNCPGTWDPLRQKGVDQARFAFRNATRFEVRFVFPPGATGNVVVPHGRVTQTEEDGAQVLGWTTDRAREGPITLDLEMSR